MKEEKVVESGMEVTFKQAKETMNYGPVTKGQTLTVSIEDGKAFIANGIAEKKKGGK